jgi:hypothetical protein
MRRKIISKRGFIISLTAAIVIGCIVHFRDPCNNPLNDDFYCRVKTAWDIPSDATNIVFDGDSNYSYYNVKLRFKASSAGLSNFTRHFCDGILHQGYDPYHAFNNGSRLDNQRLYLIKYEAHSHGFSYYSYSPDTPDSVSGNRCQPWDSPPYHIRVAQVEPDLFDIRVDAGHHLWGNDCSLIPCNPLGDNFVQPIPDLPFVIMGLEADSSNQFILVTNELCLNYQYADYHWNSLVSAYSNPEWEYLHGAKLAWSIDSQSQGNAVIAQYGWLAREGREEAYYGKLDYCAMQNWTPGTHKMALDVLTTSGQRDTYTWEFIVE